jgi:hypothetical protein
MIEVTNNIKYSEGTRSKDDYFSFHAGGHGGICIQFKFFCVKDVGSISLDAERYSMKEEFARLSDHTH